MAKAKTKATSKPKKHWRDELAVEWWPVARVKPYPKNARKNDDAVGPTAESIREFGWRQPIVVDRGGVIVAGHTRYKAALSLGLEKVPVHVARTLTPAQIRAYRLADNKTGELSEWIDDVLAVELEQLARSTTIDFEALGFDSAALAKLLDEPTGETVDVDDAPPVPSKPRTRPGDLWSFGNHRLLCGDATNGIHVSSLMGLDRADVVFTDPPYGVNIQGSKQRRHTQISGDLTQTVIPFGFELAIMSATVDGARLYFCGGEGNLGLYAKLFERHCNQLPRHLIWVKNGFTMKPNGYHCGYEIVFHGFKPGGGGLNKWYGARTEDAASDVWKISRDPSKEYRHPTQKPVALAARAIGNSCPPKGLVYEPFAGSGSTFIAAERLGRRCCGLEIDPKFCDVVVQRWENLTGRKAERSALKFKVK